MSKPRFKFFRLRGMKDPDSKNAFDEYQRVKAYRAEVIDAATLIELELNQVLCHALVGEDKDKCEQFQALILTAEFCSFFQKWKLMRNLVKSNSKWWQKYKPDIHDNQLKLLHTLISQRNAFAHGEIVFDTDNSSITLSYFEGEKKKVSLNDSYIEQVLGNAETVYLWLDEIQEKFSR